MKRNGLSPIFYAGLSFGLFTADELIKLWVEESDKFTEKDILDGNVKLEKLHNYGAANGLLKEHPGILRAISVVLFIVGLMKFILVSLKKEGNALEKLGLSLLLGGALSNITDRMIKGFVTDYFRIMKLPGKLKRIVFNISDFNIFLGSILMSIGQIKDK